MATSSHPFVRGVHGVRDQALPCRDTGGRRATWTSEQHARPAAVALLVLVGTLAAAARLSAASPAYRTLAPVCLPCGSTHPVVIDSRDKLESTYRELLTQCGEPAQPRRWREQVDSMGVRFESEALVLVYEVIGTGGTATLEVDGPTEGVLRVAIRWTTPRGPALPIATAACFALAVERSLVSRVEIRKGGVLNPNGVDSIPIAARASPAVEPSVAGPAAASPATSAPEIDWIRMHVAAPDGGSMLVAIARPRGSGPGPFPAVLVLHGSHGFAQQYVDLAKKLAQQGFVAAAACWFAGGGGPGMRFVTPVDCPGGPPVTQAATGEAHARIGALVDALRKLPYVDARRVALFGHSRGGGAALHYVLKATTVSAAILDSTGYPEDVVTNAARIKVPVLILHGARDCPDDGGSEMSTARRARAFEAAARRHRRRVESRYYDACHNGIFENPSQLADSVQRAAEFLRRVR